MSTKESLPEVKGRTKLMSSIEKSLTSAGLMSAEQAHDLAYDVGEIWSACQWTKMVIEELERGLRTANNDALPAHKAAIPLRGWFWELRDHMRGAAKGIDRLLRSLDGKPPLSTMSRAEYHKNVTKPWNEEMQKLWSQAIRSQKKKGGRLRPSNGKRATKRPRRQSKST